MVVAAFVLLASMLRNDKPPEHNNRQPYHLREDHKDTQERMERLRLRIHQ